MNACTCTFRLHRRTGYNVRTGELCPACVAADQPTPGPTMNATKNIDVLAFLDAELASARALSADAYHAQQVPKIEAVRDAVAALLEASLPFDALYQPDGPISHWDREADDRAIFGVNRATVRLGDFRRLREAIAKVRP